MDAMADVFYVHSSGFRAYDYAGRPFEPKTLHDAICWPLFTARFFRCNTTKPIIDSEDIVHDTIAAAPSEEAMDANDLAKFRERTFTARRRPDGGGRLSCDFTVPARLEADRADGSARFYLAGHMHRLSVRGYRGLTILTAEGLSLNFDQRPFGFRVFQVADDFSYSWNFHPV